MPWNTQTTEWYLPEWFTFSNVGFIDKFITPNYNISLMNDIVWKVSTFVEEKQHNGKTQGSEEIFWEGFWHISSFTCYQWKREAGSWAICKLSIWWKLHPCGFNSSYPQSTEKSIILSKRNAWSFFFVSVSFLLRRKRH